MKNLVPPFTIVEHLIGCNKLLSNIQLSLLAPPMLLLLKVCPVHSPLPNTCSSTSERSHYKWSSIPYAVRYSPTVMKGDSENGGFITSCERINGAG